MRFASKFVLVLLFFGFFQTVNAEWEKQEAKTLSWLHDIFFLNENMGWIAGSNGELIRTEDGGRTWLRDKKFTDDTIRKVHFFDKTNGLLLCERDVFTLGSDSPSYLLTTEDGGKTWKTVNFTGSDRKRITTVFFTKGGFGMAIGESGTVLSTNDLKFDWKRVQGPAEYLLNDGIFIDSLAGTIVGGAGTILFTEDGGKSWKPSFISGNEKKKLNSIFYINQNTGWTVGTEGSIYQTINGGKIWRRQETKTKETLTDICFKDTARGWAIGENGTVLQSDTAGNRWTRLDIGTKHRLEKIIFVGNKGWMVGFGGTVYYYEEETRQILREKKGT